jgi:hypothetical protein
MTFLIIRVAHVLFASLWIGAACFITFLLMPVIDALGPAGGTVMGKLAERKLTPYMGAVGGLTTLSGLWLFWRFTAGFDPAISASHAGIAFGVGGVAGILATVIGGSVVGRSANQMVELGKTMAAMGESERKAAMERMTLLKARTSSAGLVTIVLQIVALVLMVIGHYV